ncbi:MAG: hypothetical protein H9W81_01065 [Enterococcus sp.]|nr:hypothetical protein [Enterococcus sp.]
MGATVVTTTAMVVSELIRDQLEIQREKTEELAQHVAHFAGKDSIGAALKKGAGIPETTAVSPVKDMELDGYVGILSSENSITKH